MHSIICYISCTTQLIDFVLCHDILLILRENYPYTFVRMVNRMWNWSVGGLNRVIAYDFEEIDEVWHNRLDRMDPLWYGQMMTRPPMRLSIFITLGKHHGQIKQMQALDFFNLLWLCCGWTSTRWSVFPPRWFDPFLCLPRLLWNRCLYSFSYDGIVLKNEQHKIETMHFVIEM